MAIQGGTLTLLRKLRVSVGVGADQATRDLAAAWVAAWDTLAPTLRQALADTIAEAVAAGGWPPPWRLARIPRLQNALIAVEQALTQLGQRTDVTVRDAAGDIITSTVDAEARLVASQLPAAQQADAATRFAARVLPTALDYTVARTMGQITATTRPLSADAMEAVRRALVQGVAMGAGPTVAARDMLARVEGEFNGGLTRAINIARTEILDAYRAASREVHAANADVLAGWVWIASLDRRTCFPAGTKVVTGGGDLPIEDVREGDRVLTHAGRWRRVYDAMCQPYLGVMVTVEAGALRVSATGDHPFLVQREGELQWVEARNIRHGDRVFSHVQPGANRVDHGLGEVAVERCGDEPDDGVPARLQEQRLLSVTVDDLGVPVGLVDLHRNHVGGQQEVDRSLPAGHCGFLDIPHAEGIEAVTDVALGDRLTGVSSVAADGTKSAAVRRDGAEQLAAVRAVDLDRWSATRLGAVGMSGPGQSEDGAASCARSVRDLGSLAGDGAVLVSVSVALRDSEGASTSDTDLRHAGGSLVARPAAELPRTSGAGIEGLPAVSTADGDTGAGRSAHTAVRMLSLMSGVAGSATEPTATLADPCFGNLEMVSAPLTTPLHAYIVSKVTRQTQAAFVYNFEVEGDHSYIADGFAVHNCPACWSMHGTVHPVTEPGPLDHQQGRCARCPKVKPWSQMGIAGDEPADLIPDARKVFVGLPEVDQVAIMGSARLNLLRSGHISWEDLPQRRVTAGWRDSYAPRRVRDLQDLARQRGAPPPPPPAPKAPRTFADRLAAAGKDRDALDAAPTGLGRRPRSGLTRPQSYALRDYQSSYYYAINGQLRRDEIGDIVARRVARIDEAMDASRLTRDVQVWRGATDATKLFGDRLAGDLTGMVWREKAYVSTSALRRVAGEFTYPGTGAKAPVLMRMLVRRGTGAVEISGMFEQAELALERGLRLRVVRDYGMSPDGYRLLDVEVLR